MHKAQADNKLEPIRLRVLRALLPLLSTDEQSRMYALVDTALINHGPTETAKAVAFVAHGLRLNECLELARDVRDYPGPDDCPHRNHLIRELCDKLSSSMEAYLE